MYEHIHCAQYFAEFFAGMCKSRIILIKLWLVCKLILRIRNTNEMVNKMIEKLNWPFEIEFFHLFCVLTMYVKNQIIMGLLKANLINKWFKSSINQQYLKMCFFDISLVSMVSHSDIFLCIDEKRNKNISMHSGKYK